MFNKMINYAKLQWMSCRITWFVLGSDASHFILDLHHSL